MSYEFYITNFIYRELVETLEKYFLKPKPTGLILSGVVGCGKTTAVNYFLEKARRHFDVFCYTGADLQFRQNVSFDSRFILNEVKAKAKKQIFVFIDEVQKSEEVFDALKIAFDEGRISFLVTGSIKYGGEETIAKTGGSNLDVAYFFARTLYS